MSLYIVGTPIGNLQDITLRALETLKSVDFVLAEDSRKTGMMLKHFDIKKKIITYQHHSSPKTVDYIIGLLQQGHDMALVTDAGTPGVSDPGNALLEKVWDNPEVNIVPIPGVSAVTTLLSVCGFPADEFLFLGFLPKKKGRQTSLGKLKDEKKTIVFFESPNRISRTLKELQALLGDIDAVVGRELTKKFEEIQRGNLSELEKYFSSKSFKGEFTVVLDNRD